MNTSRELKRIASELGGQEKVPRGDRIASVRERVRAQLKIASKQEESSPVSNLRQRIATRRAVTAAMEIVAGTLTEILNQMFSAQLGKEMSPKEAMKFLGTLGEDLQKAIAAKFKDANKAALDAFTKDVETAVDAIMRKD